MYKGNKSNTNHVAIAIGECTDTDINWIKQKVYCHWSYIIKYTWVHENTYIKKLIKSFRKNLQILSKGWGWWNFHRPEMNVAIHKMTLYS